MSSASASKGLSTAVARLRRAGRFVAEVRDPNRMGQAYALTAMIPVIAGQEDELESYLSSLEPRTSPLGRLTQLHVSRLQLIRQLVFQGYPQRPDDLKSTYLLFTGSLDGTPERFLSDICSLLPEEADAIFSHCVGYPGTADAEKFTRWVLDCQIRTGYTLSAYAEDTVQDVTDSLALREELAELAGRAGALSDAELQQQFGQLMAGPHGREPR